MKRIGVALAVLAFTAQPALAQQDKAAIEKIVRGIYAGYGKTDGPPPSGEPIFTFRLKSAMEECTALQEKIDTKDGEDSSFGNCSEDYDVFCQCQDTFGTDWRKMAIRTRFPEADRAEAELSFDSEPGPDLKLIFLDVGGTWLIDDFWEYNRLGDGPGEACYRTRVKKSIAAMREQLKLPEWAEPAL